MTEKSKVSCSEVAALFNHGWLSRWALYMSMKGLYDTNVLKKSERVYWGIRLEAAILEGYRELRGVGYKEGGTLLNSKIGLIGHPDAIGIHDDGSVSILEVKNVDYFQYKKWEGEIPRQYQIQINCYMGLSEIYKGELIVLVGGNKLHTHSMEFDEELWKETIFRLEKFYKDLENNITPMYEPRNEADAVFNHKSINFNKKPKIVKDPLLNELVSEYLEYKKGLNQTKTNISIKRILILELMGGYSYVNTDKYSLMISTNKNGTRALRTKPIDKKGDLNEDREEY